MKRSSPHKADSVLTSLPHSILRALTRWEVRKEQGTRRRWIPTNKKQTGWAGLAWTNNSSWEKRQQGFSCRPIYLHSLSLTYTNHIAPPTHTQLSLPFLQSLSLWRICFKYLSDRILLLNKFPHFWRTSSLTRCHHGRNGLTSCTCSYWMP